MKQRQLLALGALLLLMLGLSDSFAPPALKWAIQTKKATVLSSLGKNMSVPM